MTKHTAQSLFTEIAQASDELLTVVRRLQKDAEALRDDAEEALSNYTEQHGDIDYGDDPGIALQNAQDTMYCLVGLTEGLIKNIEGQFSHNRKLDLGRCQSADEALAVDARRGVGDLLTHISKLEMKIDGLESDLAEATAEDK